MSASPSVLNEPEVYPENEPKCLSPFSARIYYIDPSENYRPEGKSEANFRTFDETSVSILWQVF